MIRKIRVKDKRNWRKLYKGYAAFYKSPINNKILDIVKMLGLKDSGYRLISNSGLNGGQEVPHYHVHIIGGEPLGSKIK